MAPRQLDENDRILWVVGFTLRWVRPYNSVKTSIFVGILNTRLIAFSALPYSRSTPAWLKTTPEQVVDQICKLAKKGATPSQIGEILRDSHGIAQTKIVTGNKILRILKGNGMTFYT